MQKRTAWGAAAAGLSALAIAGTTMMISASPASADVPWSGALCKATENIQFYAGIGGAPSYTVYAGEYIRVRNVDNYQWAWGHGEGHTDRNFVYRHANGVERLGHCH